MSGSTSYTWVGAAGLAANNWTVPANWSVNGAPATLFPNSATDAAIVNTADGNNYQIISNGQSITVASLSVGGTTVGSVQGGHVIVGGSSGPNGVGGGGGGTLTSVGPIVLTSTNSGGAIVGGLNGTVNAPSMTIDGGPDVLVGGGGTFNIPTIVNNGDILADGGYFDLGPLVLNSATIAGTGFLEVSGSSTLELNAATSQEVRVRVDPGQTASIIFDQPAAFKGSLNLLNPNSNVQLFFAGETPTGVTFDEASHALVITGAGGAVLNTIPFVSNGVVPLAVVPSTRPGFGEVTTGSGAPPSTISVLDTTTGQPVNAVATPYTGPVAGIQNEYITVSPDSLNISVSSNNWFIHSGSGTDAIAVQGGTNVLDGGAGSNFLVGGATAGSDTFFIDDRGATSDIWSTLVNFQVGDACTFWGVDSSFVLDWQDNQGAAGYTGLTLHATKAGAPVASMTLAGYTKADLDSGRVSAQLGTDAASGSNYLYIHGNS